MGPLFLQTEERIRKVRNTHSDSLCLQADRSILTVDAAQTASAEKNRSRSPASRKAGLFPVVQRGTG